MDTRDQIKYLNMSYKELKKEQIAMEKEDNPDIEKYQYIARLIIQEEVNGKTH